MNETEILKFLPNIHNIDYKILNKDEQKGFTKYQILNSCDLLTNQKNCKKIDECVDMGFLKQVNNNPPEYIPDKNKIWSFWKKTPVGEECKNMIKEHINLIDS